MEQVKYKIYSYAGPYHKEILDMEFDNLDDALDEMRRDWNGWPRRLEMPDGSNYKFKGKEWEIGVLYKNAVFRKIKNDELSAPQIYLLKQLDKSPDFKFLKQLLRRPTDLRDIFNDKDLEDLGLDKEKILKMVLDLIYHGLIDFTYVSPTSGPIDPKWR